MIPPRGLRGAQIALNAFLGATAMVGSLGLLTRNDAPPPDLIGGSRIGGFLVPALLLLLAAGGSALYATFLGFAGHRRAPIASASAGVMIVAFEIVQITIAGSPAGAARTLQAFYFLLGLTLIALSRAQLASSTTGR